MANGSTNSEQEIQAIEALVNDNPEGLSKAEIASALPFSINNKTLQRRLTALVDDGRIGRRGKFRATRYCPVNSEQATEVSRKEPTGHLQDISPAVFSPKSLDELQFLAVPPYQRERVSYNKSLLIDYIPNQHSYLPAKVRDDLHRLGKRFDKPLEAGTYAQQICQRLLIDLSYNSSRLEGNTYSRLDTQRLVEEGLSADGKVREEAVMISNHKEAILFLVENVQDFELSGMVLRNIHHLLAQDLLRAPESLGNIRKMTVHISHSAYQPLSNPHALRESFELIAQKAKRIDDPFEQSFFILVHVSYLQAFEDVNKRTARLACNIPFFKRNLCPLSFVDVAKTDYIAAILAIYERNAFAPMIDLFVWAYERSSRQYAKVKDTIGEIDPFSIKYRDQRKIILGQVVRKKLHGEQAVKAIEEFCEQNAIDDVARFVAMTMAELEGLHGGMIWSIRVTADQLKAWHDANPANR